MNNSTAACSPPHWVPKLESSLFQMAYYAVHPAFVIFGLLGHTILLYSVYRCSKSGNKPALYIYQIILLISEIVYLVGDALYALGVVLTKHSSWFQQCYICQWYRSYVALAVINIGVSSNLLISILMTVDRISGLRNPAVYHFIKTDWRAYYLRVFGSVFGSTLISVLIDICDCFRFKLVHLENGQFTQVVNTEFIQSTLGNFAGQLRNTVRAVGLVLLVILNVVLLRIYRQTVSAQDILSTTQARRRKENETTLTQLTFSQNFLTAMSMGLLLIYYVYINAAPDTYACYRNVTAPGLEAMQTLIDLINFYVIFLLNRRVREMILQSIPCCLKVTKRVSPNMDGSQQMQNLQQLQ